jgi:hypothetical protein
MKTKIKIEGLEIACLYEALSMLRHDIRKKMKYVKSVHRRAVMYASKMNAIDRIGGEIDFDDAEKVTLEAQKRAEELKQMRKVGKNYGSQMQYLRTPIMDFLREERKAYINAAKMFLCMSSSDWN